MHERIVFVRVGCGRVSCVAQDDDRGGRGHGVDRDQFQPMTWPMTGHAASYLRRMHDAVDCKVTGANGGRPNRRDKKKFSLFGPQGPLNSEGL